MLKKKSKIIIISVIIIYILFSVFSYSFAADNPLQKEIYGGIDDNPLAGGTSIVLGYIRYIGIAVCVGMVIYKGIQYVTVSPEGKADIKKDIIMIVVGMIILLAGLKIIDIVYDAVKNAGW